MSAYELWFYLPIPQTRREMYKLPQELTDHIIDFLHDDLETLRQVSLVSRAWVESSRLHLFETFQIRYPHVNELDKDDLATVSKYVRKLIYSLPDCDPAKASLVLSNFRKAKIHTVIISRRHQFSQSSIYKCFSTFPCAMITSLEFRGLLCQTQTFLAAVLLFPNIDNLTVVASQWHGPEFLELGEVIAGGVVFPSFRGRFRLTNPRDRLSWNFGQAKPLCILARIPIRFHTVSCYINKHNLGNLTSFLNACGSTVRRILLEAAYREPSPFLHFNALSHVTLSVKALPVVELLVPCAKLEELHLGDGFVDIPNAFICRVLDSISSRRLTHLSIELSDKVQEGVDWEALDNALVRLQERQHIGSPFMVKISTPLPAEVVQDCLPRFRDQGPLFIGCGGCPSRW